MSNQEESNRPQHYNNLKQLIGIATTGGSSQDILGLILPYVSKAEPMIIKALENKAKDLDSIEFDEIAYMVKTIVLPNGQTRLGLFLTPLLHEKDENDNITGAKLGNPIEKDSLNTFTKKVIIGTAK